jgi:hypothetical protein
MPLPVESLAFNRIIRSSNPLAVALACVPMVVAPALAAYQVSVRAYAAPTPTSLLVLTTETCRPGLAPGVVPPLIEDAGAPDHVMSDGNEKLEPEPSVVCPTAQGIHLSKMDLALASPVV